MERWELEQKIVDLINASGVDLDEVTAMLCRLAAAYSASQEPMFSLE